VSEEGDLCWLFVEVHKFFWPFQASNHCHKIVIDYTWIPLACFFEGEFGLEEYEFFDPG